MSMATGSASASTSSSSFTATRSAWKTRRAGWPPWRRTAAGQGRADDVGEPTVVVVTGRAATTAQRDPPGEAPFAVGGEESRQLGLGPGVHEVRGGRTLVGVHAHVEGGVGPVREAALGPVELRGAHAQVEQHAAHRSRDSTPTSAAISPRRSKRARRTVGTVAEAR